MFIDIVAVKNQSKNQQSILILFNMAETAEKVKKTSTRKSPKQIVADRGIKGAICLMISESFSLGLKNNYEGTKLANVDKDKNLLEGTRQNSMIYHLTREKGIVDRLDEKSEAFKTLKSKAQAAHPDIIADEQKYSKNVKEFINFCTTLKAPSESKVSALKAISWS